MVLDNMIVHVIVTKVVVVGSCGILQHTSYRKKVNNFVFIIVSAAIING